MSKLPANRNAEIAVPELVLSGGSNAKFAWEEFIYGEISNAHTRRAYGKAVSDLLKVAESWAAIATCSNVQKFALVVLRAAINCLPTKKSKRKKL